MERDLQKDHQVWFDVHANEEQLYHFAEKECSVIGGTLSCPELIVGGDSERRGKLFVVTLYDCDAQGVKTLQNYAKRIKTGNLEQDYAPQPRPAGCNPIASVVVARN